MCVHIYINICIYYAGTQVGTRRGIIASSFVLQPSCTYYALLLNITRHTIVVVDFVIVIVTIFVTITDRRQI